MPLNLLDSFGKKGVNYGLSTKPADVVDSDYLSKYFVVSDFNPTFTAGKNSITFNGSTYLMGGSEIFVECIDSRGQALFVEMATYADAPAQTYAYKEGTAWVFAVYVFNDTSDGIGKLTLYGTLANEKTVKWSKNITIDKTLRNNSKVRFYTTPKLDISSILVPVINSSIATASIITKTLTGVVHGLAVNPPKDTNLPSINKRNIDIDYRFVVDFPTITRNTSDVDACNSQMIGATANLIINTIQKPLSTEVIVPTNVTGTFTISDVVNNNTFKVADPYYYKDTYNNSLTTNIFSASFSVTYPFVIYNATTSSYQISVIGGNSYLVKQSYADLTYKNIRTFSGYVARHKVYRKSLLSTGDFSVIADEPITINEILRDNLTQNKYYELLGKFYNDEHIAKYWFTSSNNVRLVHTPDVAINSAFISSSTPNSLCGTDYIMVKNDSVGTNRDAVYVPFNMDQFLATSGSAYDSNFMAFKANVQYILQISTTILKDSAETSAGLEFYITSSVPNATTEKSYTDKYGLRVATIASTKNGVSSEIFDDQIFFFTPQNDIYGTLVIVPYRCQSYLKNISFRVYGDDGFSPDTYTARIPWNVATANESFEIKSELFDINHNLIYSDLRVLQSFDPSGSSLIPFMPSGSSAGDLSVTGSLRVSNNIYYTGIGVRAGFAAASASRFVSVRHDALNVIVENPVVDINSDSEHINLVLGNLPGNATIGSNIITNRKSVVSQFDTDSGRRIWYVGNTKHVDSGSHS